MLASIYRHNRLYIEYRQRASLAEGEGPAKGKITISICSKYKYLYTCLYKHCVSVFDYIGGCYMRDTLDIGISGLPD